MVDFAKARTTMVDCQIRTVDVTDIDVLSAFLTVPRETFIPEALQAFSYIDEDIALGGQRFVMEPGPLAKLIQLAEIMPTDKVLDVGAATGYAAALMSSLASSIVALESDTALAEQAKANLAAFGASNVSVVTGALEAGHAAAAPYDVILIEGAIEEIPDAIADQLAEGGRIVTVLGTNGLAAKGTIYTRSGGSVSGRPAFNTHVRPIPGFQRPKVFVF